MKDETLNRVLAAVKKELKASDLPTIEEAMKVHAAVLAGKPVQLPDAITTHLVIGMLSAMEKGYHGQPEPTPDQLDDFLLRIKDLRFVLRKTILEIAKNMPHRPGGAKPKLTTQERKRVCKLIGTLTVSGRTHSEALAIVAKRFCVSRKTVERTWVSRPRKVF